MEECSERTEVELKEMLGPAFNGRYMSVDRPAETDDTPILDEREVTGQFK